MIKDRAMVLTAYYKDTMYARFINNYVSEMYPNKANEFTDDHLLEAVRIGIEEYDSLYDTMTASVRNDKGLYSTTCNMYKDLAHQAIKDYCDNQLMEEEYDFISYMNKGVEV